MRKDRFKILIDRIKSNPDITMGLSPRSRHFLTGGCIAGNTVAMHDMREWKRLRGKDWELWELEASCILRITESQGHYLFNHGMWPNYFQWTYNNAYDFGTAKDRKSIVVKRIEHFMKTLE